MKRFFLLFILLGIYTFIKAQISNETMPRFMDGDLNTFRSYMLEKVEIPNELIETLPRKALISGVICNVLYSFTVMPDSTVDKISVHSCFDPHTNDEFISMLKATDKLWTPGIQNGIYVPVSLFSVPIKILYPEEYRTKPYNLLLSAESNMESKKYSDAIINWNEYLSIKPMDYEAYYERAICNIKLENYDKVCPDLELYNKKVENKIAKKQMKKYCD